MKAYVIKNKVHGYFGVNNMYQYPEWSSIDLAYYFKTEKEAKEFKNKNYPTCKVVEITIAEGDLEEENRILKSKLYEIWYNFATIGEICVTESKKEISSENAVEEIRNYLSNIDLCFDEIKEKLGTDYFIKQAKGEIL